MTIRVNGPGGIAINFPDGTDEETIIRAMHQAIGAGEKPSQLGTLGEGALQGLSANFRDEIYGASEASGLPNILGGFRAPIGAARLAYEGITGRGSATDTYERARDEKRQQYEAMKKEHPGTAFLGEIGGSLALPVGGIARATAGLGRAATGAAIGGAYGGLAGIGEGHGLTDSLSRGGTGALLGGAIGGVGAPVVERGAQLLGRGASAVSRRLRNLDDEADIRVAAAVDKDIGSGRTGMAPNEFVNTPEAALVDIGGENTRALARSAANLSPDGRAALSGHLDERYTDQGNRIIGWLNNNFNFPNDYVKQQAIDAASRAANKPAYKTAYDKGSDGIWSPELERLAGSDTVRSAMMRGAKNAEDESIIGGYGAMNPRVDFTPDGRMQLHRSPSGMPVYPDLQFWDLTRRELSGMAAAAKRAGNDTDARRFSFFAESLNKEMDKVVPEYKAARSTAKSFFDAEDALEAGRNFVHQNKDLEASRRAFLKLPATEKKLFQDGFLSKFIEDIRKIPDSHDVVKRIYNSPEARNKINMVLGGKKGLELEAMLRIEGLMNLPRQALGNSTTIRQRAELGLASVSGGAIGAIGTGDLTSPWNLGTGLIGYALSRGKHRLDDALGRKIAERLVSRDVDVFIRGVKLLASSTKYMDRLRKFDDRLVLGTSQQANVGVSAQGAARAEEE